MLLVGVASVLRHEYEAIVCLILRCVGMSKVCSDHSFVGAGLSQNMNKRYSVVDARRDEP